MDACPRECRSIDVARRLRSDDILARLTARFVPRGPPDSLRSDNGQECTASAVRSWLQRLGVTTRFIAPGSPWENGYLESFNGTLRDEGLNPEIFTPLPAAPILIARWRREDNQVRPHIALDSRPPAPDALEIRPPHPAPWADRRVAALTSALAQQSGAGHQNGNFQRSKFPMTNKNRPVADRQKSLQPVSPEAHFPLAGVRQMYEGGGGKEFHCTINGYCRTQIFEFPGIDFHPDRDEPHHTIYASLSVQACIASNLVDYFVNSTFSKHYAISPSLRHAVSETDEKIKSQQKARIPVFLVIEESSQLTPVEMIKGEYSISDEVVVRDSIKEPMLTGGREGEKFITVWAAVDGAWPELPNNQQLVNMILAGVRAGQQTPHPIRKYLNQNGLVTDDSRFVVLVRPTMSVRASTAMPMDVTAYRARASEIRKGIAAMKQDMRAPHLALLVNSMYRDEYKDDAYQRLQYLQLWQSLVEAGQEHLGYQGKSIKYDKEVVAGKKTLRELTEYRHAIAHWWTDTIDESFLEDLQRTINELIHRKYF